jgi:potassium voltage-gated channel Shal-related subfamily D member 2
MDLMLLSLQMSRGALVSLFFFSFFFMTVFATLLYFSERGLFYPDIHYFTARDHTERPLIEIVNTKFESIPAALWYVIVTMTTVGYGDMIPQSILGKLLSIPLMYFGILVSLLKAPETKSTDYYYLLVYCIAIYCYWT